MENLLERVIYASRWLLAPVFFGISLALLALAVKFYQELFHFIPHLLEMPEEQLVLEVLSLVDMVLVGTLMVMVMIGGYENSVSHLELDEETDKLSWLGKLDPGSLKMKVAASIVAISSIHLLKIFMNAEHIANDKIFWYLILHLTFVLSAFGMGYMDKFGRQSHGHAASHRERED